MQCDIRHRHAGGSAATIALGLGQVDVCLSRKTAREAAPNLFLAFFDILVLILEDFACKSFKLIDLRGFCF